MDEHDADVLIVGAGPVGLTMACELARHGSRPRIIDRMAKPLPFCRAIGVTPRTLEVWDDMGVIRDMIDGGIWFTGARVIVDGKVTDTIPDLSDLPYGMLGIPQYETERILTARLTSFGISIERGVSLESLTQRDGAVEVVLVSAAGSREAASFKHVVGCDGAHSTVRHALDIPFEGDAFPYEFILGDVKIDWDLPRGMAMRAVHPVPDGPPEMFIAVPLPEQGRYRVSMMSPQELSAPGSGSDHGIQAERPAPGLAPLQAVATRLVPGNPRLSDLRWSSIFRISMRLAASYRKGGVFLAGDAAHIHPPTGGQGMNTGIQDAYNLAWKMALVTRGMAPPSLLDSYEAERRPVGQDVVERTTKASVGLGHEKGPDARLGDTQVLVNYRASPIVASGAGSTPITGPVAGDRVPDCSMLRQQGVEHGVRLFDILRGTRHTMVALCEQKDQAAVCAGLAGWSVSAREAGLVRSAAIVEQGANLVSVPGVTTYVDGGGEARTAFGAPPAFLLIRPDGYLAWRGSSLGDPALVRVMAQTFRV